MFWAALVLLTALWLLADPGAVRWAGFFPLREAAIQLTGILAIGCMSMAMILALRPRWLEGPAEGLDKLYRLHKWLGIGGLVLAIVHWLWSEAAKWAVGLGWLDRGTRGMPPAISDPIELFLSDLRDPAEGLGEWAFYAAVLLIAAALITRIPYHVFYLTHRLLAVAYLVLAFHTVVLAQFSYWTTPLGVVLGALLIYGVVAAVLVLFRRVGAGRKVAGAITGLHYYPELRVLEGDIDIPAGWPGHRAGQFAFVRSNGKEGAHPYTIASSWRPSDHRLTFIVKELGDHTRRLRETLRVGQPVTVEGPYGRFTFDDGSPRQIWIGGGIGITPFIARMKQLADDARSGKTPSPAPEIDLFHTTADYSDEAVDKLAADAQAANVRLHVLHDARDGLLSGSAIREVVPDWREASIWFCGPVGFGAAIRRNFAESGFPVASRFHQELFSMR
jgi:predicted ferric reductase